MPEDRLKIIQQHLYQHGTSSIEALVACTRTSAATIRRDLARLEADGLIERTHGGARLAESSGREVAFSLRERERLEAKRAIGHAAYQMLRPGSTVLMDAGTTVLQLAKAIRMNPMPLTVITNGLALAQELAGIEGVTVISLGGHLRADNLSTVGPYAEKQLGEFWCDHLFLGATAINDENHLMTLDAGEAAINRTMLERAEQRVLLADSSKFSHHGPYRVAHLERVSQVITDDALNAIWVDRIHNLGLGLERVGIGVRA